VGSSSVRQWVNHFKDGNKDTTDQPCSVHLQTASTERNKGKIGEFIKENQCVTAREMAAEVGIGCCADQEMVESLCLLGSSLADGEAQTSMKKFCLTTDGRAWCQRW
jgi:hypothetical protein